MSTAQQTNGHHDANPLLRTVVQTIGLGITLLWSLAVLSLFVGGSAYARVLIMLLGTPLFIVFVVPALIYNKWGGPSGAKVGAALMLVGFIVTAAIIAWPFVGPTIR